MNKDEANCAQVTRFLVSPVTANQPSFVLQPNTVIKAIPISVESLLFQATTTLPNSVPTQPSHSINVFQDFKTNDERVPAKGRRPKHIVPEVDGRYESGPAMLADRPMCRSCGKYFMSRQQLNQHMLVHTDVRKYKCSYCDRTFKQPSHLHQHHRIHTGEKPYKCPVPECFRAFPQQSNLNHHLRNHDKPAPPPENTCSLCMRTYASETVLRSHISKIHMCDPDALLGFRKETHPGNFSKHPNDEKAVPSVSVSYSVGEMLSKTNSSKDFQKQTNFDEFHAPIFVAKQESDIESSGNTPDFNSRMYSGKSVHDFKLDTKHLNIQENTSETVVRDKDISINNDTYISIPTTDESIINSFGTVTTQKHNGKTDASQNVLTPDITAFPVSNNKVPYHHDETTSTETLQAVQTGRSRKRKAFQPQRIVKYHHVNDDK